MFKPDPKEYSKYFFIAFFILLAYLAYLMVGPYLGAIMASLIIAYGFFPVYRLLLKGVKNKHLAASLMTISVLLIIVLPVAIVMNLLIRESISLYNKIDIAQIAAIINSLLDGKLEGYVEPFFQNIIGYIAGLASSIVLSLPQKILAFFVLLFMLFFAFRDSKVVIAAINRSLPVSEIHKRKLAEKFKNMMDAVIYGTISIAIVQGIFAMIGFYVFGIQSPVLWGLITAVVAILPFVGPATVWVPLSIYHYINGHHAAAIGLAVYGIIILSIVLDMIVKPKLISSKGRIHPIMALLGVIGGIKVFGVTGIILGPFVLSVFIFFVRVLMENETKG